MNRLLRVVVCSISAVLCTVGCSKEANAKTPSNDENKKEVAEFNSKEHLDGLFGIKFGKVMGASESCVTNDVSDLVYVYEPEKQFKGFSRYTLFATPMTRQVYQIRALCSIGDDTGDEVFDSAIRAMEIKFKKSAEKYDSKTKVLYFENGDLIIIKKDSEMVKIEASSARLSQLKKEEVARFKKTAYSADIAALCIQPEMDREDNKVYRIDEVLGQKFGDRFVGNGDLERTSDGAWVREFKPERAFLNCREYYVHYTVSSKKNFMVRAIYTGSDTFTKKWQFRTVIEIATGRTMKETNDGYVLFFGDVGIVMDCSRRNKIDLAFTRTKLWQQNESEIKEWKDQKNRADADAL